MKKSFKILSCLAVAVVAFIMSFTLVKVSGDSEEVYTKSLDNGNIIFEQNLSNAEFSIEFTLSYPFDETKSYFVFEYENDDTQTTYLAQNLNVIQDGTIWIFEDESALLGELIELKLIKSDDTILFEYPETIPEEGGETMGGFITQVFETLGDIIEGFSSTLVSLFENVVKIFYTAPTGSETVGSLTVVGVLTLVAMGCGLVIWGFKFLRSLIRVKTK